MFHFGRRINFKDGGSCSFITLYVIGLMLVHLQPIPYAENLPFYRW